MTQGLTRALIPSLPLAAVLAFLLVPIARRIAAPLGFVDHPRADRFHSRPVPLLGGPPALVAAILGSIGGWIALGRPAVFATALAPSGLATAVVFGTGALLALGLVDDRKAIPPFRKGVAMGGILAVAILIWRPDGCLGGPAGWGITWFAGMFIVNAWNYLDHADGIFATAAAVGTGTLAFAAHAAGETMVAAALGAVCGSLVGYLIWNAPPARIFLGDSGSLPLGFILFLGSVALIDQAPRSTRPAVLASNALPIVDISLVTIVRLWHGRNPFHGGREHSGHRLASRFGPRSAVIIVACAALFFCAAGILPGPGRAGLSLSVIAAGMLLSIAWLGRVPPPA